MSRYKYNKNQRKPDRQTYAGKTVNTSSYQNFRMTPS